MISHRKQMWLLWSDSEVVIWFLLQELGLIQAYYSATSGMLDTQPVGRVFLNGLGDLGSIPGRVTPKTLKMVLATSPLNTLQYKVRIKGKVELSRERSCVLCPWCTGYRRRKWTRRHEFKSWTRPIAFHIALIPWGKV